MAKKYIGLDEAAQMLGIEPDALIRHREKGDIRGFADRGTWKFKLDDLEEFKRRLQADSNPDVPILSESEPEEDAGSSSVFGGEEDEVGEQSTAIRSGSSDVPSDGGDTSDSDVRLILDDNLTEGADSDPDVEVAGETDSDSDVQLVGDSDTRLEGDSDSDVQLVEGDGGDTEQDLSVSSSTTGGDPGSDSDVRLIDEDETAEFAAADAPKSDEQKGSDSDVTLVPSEEGGSSVVLEDESEGSSVLAGKSDAPEGDDSGISLAAESGISLDSLDDSGLSLEQKEDQAAESGISLAGADDSGLSILDEAEDSGISLEKRADSGGAPEGDEAQQTVPLMNQAGSAAQTDETELEVPSQQGDDESDFDLKLGDSELDTSDESSSVLLFGDEDQEEPTTVEETGQQPADLESEEFDLESVESGADLDVVEDDDLAAEEILGDEDEDLEVEFAVDEDFDEGLETGESHTDLVATPRTARQAEVAVAEAEWGVGTFIGLMVSTLFMALCMMLMFDLVRSMWSWQQPTAFNSGLLDMFGGLF